MASPTRTRPGRLLLVLIAILVALAGWIVVTGVNTPRLGLDLQGGTSVTLQPKPAPGAEGEVTQESIDQAVLIIQDRVNGSGVAEAEVTAQGSGNDSVIVVSVPGVTESDLVEQLGQTARLAFRPVLVQTAGTPAPPVPTPTPSDTKTPGGGQPGGGGQGGGGDQGGQGGQNNGAVLPRLADGGGQNGPSEAPTKSAEPSPSSSPSPGSSGEPTTPTDPTGADAVTPELQKQLQKLDCSDPKQRTVGSTGKAGDTIIACSQDGAAKYILAPVAVDGANVDNATANLQQQGVGWEVSLDFDSVGTTDFATTTQKLSAQQGTPPLDQFAIVLDGLVISAPGVNEPILGGQASITGQFTQADATDLANVLKYGALPLAFDIGERQTVSPTLGQDQLDAGLIAGALGLVLVVLYLLMYYRALAFVAVMSLVIAAALVYGTVVLLGETLGFTLTLAGVAGLIVAIGITADSFIVYFERMRDEVRDGRSLRVALEVGWTRAKRTIIAADSISIIAAVILYLLSIGSVRGFAFTLGLTTLIDLLVVFLFTKPLMTMLAKYPFFNSGSKWSGLSPERLGAKNASATPETITSRRRTARQA